jgi:ABC-type sugar transport system permease subunit
MKPETTMASQSQTLARRFHSEWQYYLFILPGFLLLLLFFYYPAASAIFYSFYDWDGSHKIYVGVENFRQMLVDPILRDSFKNLGIVLIIGLILSNVVPLIIAEMIFSLKSQAWRSFFQIAFLVTGLVPIIVVLLIWQFIFDPYMGPLNALLAQLGFDKMDFLWLADPHWALYCLFLIGFPWIAGTSVLIFLSGLNNIPSSILDYCRLEGVGALRRFWAIDLFYIMGQLRLLLITGVIGLMQSFGMQLILTKGGPGTATFVPGYHMYINAFSYDQLGYASAIGLLIALIILAFTLVGLKFLKISKT